MREYPPSIILDILGGYNMSSYNIPNSQQIMEIFRPRIDAFAIWRTSSPAPERTDGKKDIPLGLSYIESHLNSTPLIGFYSTSRDDTCTWAAIDIDSFATATNDAIAVVETLQRAGFEPLLERSKSVTCGCFSILPYKHTNCV